MRIVVRSQDARTARSIADALEPAGLTATALTGDAALRPAPAGEDVTLLDARDAGAANAFAESLRALNGPSLAYVGASNRAGPPPNDDRLDAWVALDGPPASLARRLRAALRQGVREAEVTARARTRAALALPAAPMSPRATAPQALFVGRPSPVYLALQDALAARGGRLGGAFTAFSAFDHIHGEDFDALALNVAGDAEEAMSFIGAVRRNRALAAWPIHAFEAPAGVREAVLARGADEAFAPGDDLAAAAGWLAHDIGRIRQRHAAATALAASTVRQDEAFAFLGFHLAGLAQTHHDRGWPLSVGAIELHGARRTDTEKWRRGFGEIAHLATRIARASDSAAAMNETRLVFAFPATSLVEAEAALRRIVEVCDCTAFAAGDHGGPPLQFFIRAAELSPGESGAGLLARLLDLEFS